MTAANAFPPWRTPRELVVDLDILLAVFNQDRTVDRGLMVYILACGHREIGRIGSRRLHCTSCQRIWDLGLDYDGWRRGVITDPLLDLPTADAAS